jgi:hypothetical protein
VYEDELTTETWKFDLDKFANGPIEVDIKYKAGAEKTLKLRAKEAKQEKKIAKQMKKINEKQNGKKIIVLTGLAHKYYLVDKLKNDRSIYLNLNNLGGF